MRKPATLKTTNPNIHTITNNTPMWPRLLIEASLLSSWDARIRQPLWSPLPRRVAGFTSTELEVLRGKDTPTYHRLCPGLLPHPSRHSQGHTTGSDPYSRPDLRIEVRELRAESGVTEVFTTQSASPDGSLE
jgi:hypothetical protein